MPSLEYLDPIASLIAGLGYSGGATGSYWHMLKHAEINGFDLAVLKPSIRASIIAVGGQRYDLNEARERLLILHLRDCMRLEAFHPPLTASEKADWAWEIPPIPYYNHSGHPGPKAGKTSSEQNRRIANRLMEAYPEAARYLRCVRDANQGLGYNGGPYDVYIVRQTWHVPFMRAAGFEILGGDTQLDIDFFEIEQLVAPFPDRNAVIDHHRFQL